MPDVREVFDMVTQKAGPEPGAMQRQMDKQRKHARNQKLTVIGVVVLIFVGGAAVFLGARPSHGTTPASQPPSSPSPVAFNTTPPIGAQIVALDGTPQQQIPGLPSDASGLQLSPDGQTIAFHVGSVDGGSIDISAVDGSGLRVLAGVNNSNSGDAQTAVSWSPDGLRLAYSSSGNIYLVGINGGNPFRLTSSTSGTGNFFPAWSPDGWTIAYWSGSTTGQDGGPTDSEIYTVRLRGGPPMRLTHDNVSSIEPTWSPDGKQIAYWSGGELWTMGRDGSNQHRVYAGTGGAWAPAWSPDGKQIAFLAFLGQRSLDGGPLLQVRILDLRTDKVHSLHMNVETDYNGPSWAASGTALLVNRYN